MANERKPGRWVVEVILVDNHLLQDILNGSIEEASFDNEEEARRDCDRREREIREQLGPFCGWQGDLSMLTSLGSDVFCDWLLDAGIDPPAPADGTRDWKGWYDRVADGWDDDTRHRFWQGLDQPRFYRVSERPQRKAYAVLEVGWLKGKKRPRNSNSECRRTVAVFSNRAAAERCRSALEQQRKQSPAYVPSSEEEKPLFEVVEVDWVGPADGRSVVLVQRRAVFPDEEWEQDIIWNVARDAFTPYMPLRLFGDRASAEAYRDEILSRVRLMLNPFDLGSLDALTSLTPQALCDSLSELNITPPEPEPEKPAAWFWSRWWYRTEPTLNREQIEGIWGLLDRLRLLEVVELPLDQPLSPGSLP